MIAVADIPLKKAVAGVRVGLLPELGFVVNPTVQQMEESKLDLIMAGTESAVLMIEGYCDFLTEDQMLEVFSILGLLPCAWLKECVLLLRLCCWCCCYLLKAFNHSAVCQPSFLDCPEGRGGEGRGVCRGRLTSFVMIQLCCLSVSQSSNRRSTT